MVQYLILEQGIKCNIKSTKSGSQPIHLATNAGHTHIVEYLIKMHGCNPLDVDSNEENCLTLAIKNRKREVAIWLVKSDQFPLGSVIRRRGFNYFAYSLVKGQQVVAKEILKHLKAKGLADDDVINQKIETPTNADVTLFDLCLNRRYKSGLNFLMHVCRVNVPIAKQEAALTVIEEGSSIKSLYENGASMADRTSHGSGVSRTITLAATEEKKVRHISRGRNMLNL